VGVSGPSWKRFVEKVSFEPGMMEGERGEQVEDELTLRDRRIVKVSILRTTLSSMTIMLMELRAVLADVFSFLSPSVLMLCVYSPCG